MIKKTIKHQLKRSYLALRDWTAVGTDEVPRKLFLSGWLSAAIYSVLARISAAQDGWTGALWAINCSLYFRQNIRSYTRKAEYLLALKQSATALDVLETALEHKPSDYEAQHMLAATLIERRQWNEAISQLESMTGQRMVDVNMLTMLATAYQKNKRFTDSLEIYNTILAMKGLKDDTKHTIYYEKGLALRRLGRDEESDEALKKALLFTTDKIVKRLGVGFLHEQMRNYDDALSEYQKQLTGTAGDAELLLHLGNISRDMFAVDAALDYHTKALRYRKSDALYHYELGLTHEFAGDVHRARKHYEQAVAYEAKNKLYNYRLGLMLAKDGDESKANQLFLASKIFSKASKLGAPVSDMPSLRQQYAEYRESFTVQEKTILYESMLGMMFSCSPYALFKELLEDARFTDYTHIWVIDDASKVPAWVKKHKNVIVIIKHSSLYAKWLASVEYLINNSTFPSYFTRRSEQQYLNTWHGTPWKTLGADIKGEIFGHANTARNLLQASHILSPNEHTTSVLLDSNDIAKVYTAEVAEVGYPRIDLTVASSEAHKRELAKRLNLDVSKKTVLYAPTWRGTMSDKNVDIKRTQRDIKSLQELDANILFRGHHYTENRLRGVTVVPSDIDTNELLSVVDGLVTDYSSISFDFMATGKPIVYYLYDLEEYSASRGLYFSPDEMPGVVTTTMSSTVTAVDDALRDENDVDDVYESARQRFCPHDDGKATKRTIEWLFFGKLATKYRITPPARKPSILMYAGAFKPNGITTSFLNLLSHIDTEQLDVATIVTTKDLQFDSSRLKKYNEQPQGVSRLGDVDGMATTLMEKKALSFLAVNHRHANDASRHHYEIAYQREFRRCFGDKQFTTVVEYSGYSPYWTSLFAQANAGRKVIYTHNDLEAEREARFANLEDVFRQYPYYTKIISVSTANRDINKRKIAKTYDVDEKLFDYCDNVQDGSRVLTMMRAEPDKKVLGLFRKDDVKFINLARLSPEKDHQKLIEAFRIVVDSHQNARLYICGDGPLWGSLASLIEKLGLEHHVYLLGFQENPYAIMNHADCFVLSSNYEGQPVVLYEAMTAGLTVVATDIDANRNVLTGGYGHLVDNSVEGLADGMKAFVDGTIHSKKFDIIKHEQVSYDMFVEKVLGL